MRIQLGATWTAMNAAISALHAQMGSARKLRAVLHSFGGKGGHQACLDCHHAAARDQVETCAPGFVGAALRRDPPAKSRRKSGLVRFIFEASGSPPVRPTNLRVVGLSLL